MPIYPVRIKEWYKIPYDEGYMSAFGSKWELLQEMLPHIECHVCGKPVKATYGYVMHSITFGGRGEGFCTKKCLNNWFKGRGLKG